ncbi:MAG: DUF5711 family protein [Oscillospiraceae bacterium]|nr:DUF5711 family protein [Oscillospiraceae bacterium]
MSSINSYETDIKKLRRSRRTKRIFRRLTAVVAMLVVVLLVYISRDGWLPYFENILEESYESATSTTLEEEEEESNFPFDVSSRSNVSIGAMRDCWVMFSDTSITTYDISGATIQSVYAPYGTPTVEATSTRALVYDMGGYSLMVIGRRNEIFEKKLEDQILFAELGEKGNIAVVTSTDKYVSYLTIYDKNGTEIFHWADGNYIMAVAMNDSGSGCAVASIYASGGIIKTVVNVLDFSSTEIQAKSSAIETLVLDIEFTDDDEIWLVGSDEMYLLSSDCTVSYTYDYTYDISGFSAKDDVCVITFEKPGSDENVVAIFEAGLDETAEITYNEEVRYVLVDDGEVYLNTASELYRLDSSGELKSTTSLGGEYTSFVIYNDNAILLNYRSVVKAALD